MKTFYRIQFRKVGGKDWKTVCYTYSPIKNGVTIDAFSSIAHAEKYIHALSYERLQEIELRLLPIEITLSIETGEPIIIDMQKERKDAA